MQRRFFLRENWKFRIEGFPNSNLRGKKVIKPGQWINADVPGTVHTDLFKAEIIPDPFFADNEADLQWISGSDWTYKTVFDLPKDFVKDEPVYLVFEGIDTIAGIYLNNAEIGHTENMFLKYEFDISGKVKKRKNELLIRFTSASKYGRSEEEKFGVLPVALNTERVYVRKAQYSFGWDWGPSFATCGLWRPVYLEQKSGVEIYDVTFNTISLSDRKAVVEIKAGINNINGIPVNVKIKLSAGRRVFEITAEDSGTGLVREEIEITDPKLWWPNNYGEQNLYDLIISALDEKGNILFETERKVGIRTIILNLDNHGKPSFNFIINEKPVFIKGANWIPSDSFLPRVSDEKYSSLTRLAKEANMNMLRVWGGGIYENDIFYDLCDEMGILVWHDFMFACASYPDNEEFMRNVGDEIKQNVSRLQFHPSIAIWCGNNENEWIWHQQQKKSYKEMPGYKIYHALIPDILNEIDPKRPYWPSSPFGNEDDPNSEVSGNRHQWNLWSNWKDYSLVKDDKSLFVTEFGFQSSASSETIKKALPKEAHHSQSRLFEYHNKQVEGTERLFKFMSAHLPIYTGLDDFVYLTQLNQGLALRECLEHWQLRYPQTNGAVIWQLNDCWPVASWSLVDSGLIPKISYFMVKRSFSGQIILFAERNGSLEIGVMNYGTGNFKGTLEIKYVNLPSGKIETTGRKKIYLGPLSRHEIFSIRIPEELKAGKSVIIASIFDPGKKLLNRNFYKELEWKHLTLPAASVKTELNGKKDMLRLKTDKPAFFVYVKNKTVEFGDNALILLPGEEAAVPVKIKDKKTFKNKFEIELLNKYLKNKL